MALVFKDEDGPRQEWEAAKTHRAASGESEAVLTDVVMLTTQQGNGMVCDEMIEDEVRELVAWLDGWLDSLEAKR